MRENKVGAYFFSVKNACIWKGPTEYISENIKMVDTEDSRKQYFKNECMNWVAKQRKNKHYEGEGECKEGNIPNFI
jgi:multimeric flavodoxin WrbA